jgi:hypothetical protein
VSSPSTFVAKPFRYFDGRGECEFPTPDRVRADIGAGRVTTRVLDANVCLPLSNYARGRTDADTEARIRQFLLAIAFVRVDVVPFFGCLELAYKRGEEQADQGLLSNIVLNVARALDQNEESLASGAVVSSAADGEPPIVNGSIGVVCPLLRYFYCCLLRILEIRFRRHLKPRAVKNFVEFFDWCEAMRCHVALVSQAALALFGGSTDAQRLINVKSGKTPLDAAWRAAWDMWHCWMVQNYFAAVPADGVLLHPIFVTGDTAAAFVAGRCIPRVAFQNNGEPFLSTSEVDPDAMMSTSKTTMAILGSRALTIQVTS